MRRYGRSTFISIFRKTPIPLVLAGVVLVIICPIALLHFTSKDPSAGTPLNDAPNPVKSDKLKQREALQESLESGSVLRPPEIHDQVVPLESSQLRQVVCPAVAFNAKKPDFDLANLTYTLTNLKWDGDIGIWDGEMEAEYKQIQAKPKAGKENPLLVYVVPFSHSDPGWLSTVEEYFMTSTKFALDNMLSRLNEWQDMTFIWAETSFFKMWWATLDPVRQEQVRALTKSGRLEIVNGGYVMPDEANCNYYAILHQYIYGHQWLLDNVGVTPEHGFSIDPFGHSSSMPYFLKNLDFKSMFIQRIHYNLRKHLGKKKATEFMWEQPWDASPDSSMFTHLAPHHLYTIRNICGLSQGNCYFFDFKDVMFDVEMVQMDNQARLLLEELRKTASIYPHNVLLYILGDDFRWSEPTEWTNQYKNYKRLMKVINSNPSNNAVIKFGTLKNYYDAVFERNGPPESPKQKPLPTVQGDFFPYADKFEDYWTGYFTSRPFYKQMSRELERDLRSAEILLVLAKLENPGKPDEFHDDLIGLERAAESLGLFQHHDAITGTSKRAVAMDYGEKLQNGLLMAHAVILKNVFRLAQSAHPTELAKPNIILESYRPSALSLPTKSALMFGKDNMERIVFIFNPLTRSRMAAINLLSHTPNLVILDAEAREIAYQVSPASNDDDTQGLFYTVAVRISFLIQLDPLSLKAISIKSHGPRTEKIRIQSRYSTSVRTTDLANDKMNIPGFPVKSLDVAKMIVLSNEFMTAKFRADDGMLQSLETKQGGHQHVQMELKRYETTASGAYLFRPNGIADIMPYPYRVRVLEGPLFSEIRTMTTGIVLTVRLYHSASDLSKSLEMELITDMSIVAAATNNAELVLRLSTEISNNLTFYTDSNGFQTVQRRVSHVLPMAANYYPATSMGFLQDEKTRLTLHLNQAHGVGSQRAGELEVMVDRFLSQDDARGVGEPLQDVRVVRTQIQLQMETGRFCTGCPYKNPTDTGNRINFAANHPAYVTFEQAQSNLTTFDYKPVKQIPPCDHHLLMLKPVTYKFSEQRVGFLFHRHGMDCSRSAQSSTERDEGSSCIPGKDKLLMGSLLRRSTFKSYNETSLNFINSRKRHLIKTPVHLKPMTIAALTVIVK